MNTWTNCLHENYSMIEDTVPDPTAHPPSRYLTGVLRYANDDFSCDSCGKIRNFRCVHVVFGDFVIMIMAQQFRLHSAVR